MKRSSIKLCHPKGVESSIFLINRSPDEIQESWGNRTRRIWKSLQGPEEEQCKTISCESGQNARQSPGFVEWSQDASRLQRSLGYAKTLFNKYCEAYRLLVWGIEWIRTVNWIIVLEKIYINSIKVKQVQRCWGSVLFIIFIRFSFLLLMWIIQGKPFLWWWIQWFFWQFWRWCCNHMYHVWCIIRIF